MEEGEGWCTLDVSWILADVMTPFHLVAYPSKHRKNPASQGCSTDEAGQGPGCHQNQSANHPLKQRRTCIHWLARSNLGLAWTLVETPVAQIGGASEVESEGMLVARPW